MLAFPEMLISAAQDAGIKVPENARDFDRGLYPHFEVFCLMQLGQSMPYHGVHFENAKVIASFSEEEIKKATAKDIIDRGFSIGNSSMYA